MKILKYAAIAALTATGLFAGLGWYIRKHGLGIDEFNRLLDPEMFEKATLGEMLKDYEAPLQARAEGLLQQYGKGWEDVLRMALESNQPVALSPDGQFELANWGDVDPEKLVQWGQAEPKAIFNAFESLRDMLKLADPAIQEYEYEEESVKTYWNGVETPAERGTAIVADSAFAGRNYWARRNGLVGERIPVVKIGGQYLDDRLDIAWNKVTSGFGSPSRGHRNVYIVTDSFEPL